MRGERGDSAATETCPQAQPQMWEAFGTNTSPRAPYGGLFDFEKESKLKHSRTWGPLKYSATLQKSHTPNASHLRRRPIVISRIASLHRCRLHECTFVKVHFWFCVTATQRCIDWQKAIKYDTFKGCHWSDPMCRNAQVQILRRCWAAILAPGGK